MILPKQPPKVAVTDPLASLYARHHRATATASSGPSSADESPEAIARTISQERTPEAFTHLVGAVASALVRVHTPAGRKDTTRTAVRAGAASVPALVLYTTAGRVPAAAIPGLREALTRDALAKADP